MRYRKKNGHTIMEARNKDFLFLEEKFQKIHPDWNLPCWVMLKAGFRLSYEKKETRYFFDHAIRPCFLKYLPKAFPELCHQLFKEEDLSRMENGINPQSWNIHHQKPLLLGGRHMNGSFYDIIESRPLPEGMNLRSEEAFAMKFDSYLAQKESEGTLAQTMNDIFSGYIVLLPYDFHKALEEDIIKYQTHKIPKELNGITFELHVPYWLGLANNGKIDDEQQNSNETRGYPETHSYTKKEAKNREIELRKLSQKEMRENPDKRNHLDKVGKKVAKHKDAKYQRRFEEREERYYGDY